MKTRRLEAMTKRAGNWLRIFLLTGDIVTAWLVTSERGLWRWICYFSKVFDTNLLHHVHFIVVAPSHSHSKCKSCDYEQNESVVPES